MDKNNKLVYAHGTRTGIGVIEALETYGGINNYNYAGAGDNCIYFIMPGTNLICMTHDESVFSQYITAVAKEIKPTKPLRWRAKQNDIYYLVDSTMSAIEVRDYRTPLDDDHYNCGNYFKTKEEAQEIAEKIKKILLPD